jgi:hypothetical protein
MHCVKQATNTSPVHAIKKHRRHSVQKEIFYVYQIALKISS